MSEQIREQVSAFLDGELPDSETELLLKRLTRAGELRESFGRYALIGEAIRGASLSLMTKGFAGRVNLAIDGEPVPANGQVLPIRAPRWWRPVWRLLPSSPFTSARTDRRCGPRLPYSARWFLLKPAPSRRRLVRPSRTPCPRRRRPRPRRCRRRV